MGVRVRSFCSRIICVIGSFTIGYIPCGLPTTPFVFKRSFLGICLV
ncbi:histidine kinase [Helicobacter pylori]|nr:histidine kinase [Helicobacter pylori]